jgi:hypothetical protein
MKLARPHCATAAVHLSGNAPPLGKAASMSQHKATVSAMSRHVSRAGAPIWAYLRRERDLLSWKLSSIQKRWRYQAVVCLALG